MTENTAIQKPEKPVYKTMVPPHPESVKNLTGWQRPNRAYVLLEIPQLNIISEGERSWGKGLVTLNAESRAEIMHQVEIYINKGGRVLDYGNFPSLLDRSPARAAKALNYSQGVGQEPWGALEQYIKTRMARDVNWQGEKIEMQAEIDALKAKLAAEQEKLAFKAEAPRPQPEAQPQPQPQEVRASRFAKKAEEPKL